MESYIHLKKVFQERTVKINGYLKAWNVVGFRSPDMHHNLEWIQDFDIEYDASTFDTDPFEPQPDGVGTIYPFWVSKDGTQDGYVELPYTLPQDFTLFILMKEKNIDIWKKKLDWVAENGGMALVNTHPEYMKFSDGKLVNLGDVYSIISFHYGKKKRKEGGQESRKVRRAEGK